MRILAAIMLWAALVGSAIAQEGESTAMSQEQMLKVYEAAAKPGAEHAMLAKSAGRWNCTVKAWMDPTAEPQVSEGTEESEMTFGGRYLQSHFKGSMMGQPYEGMGTLGYDNVKKKYVGTWFDTMSTGIMGFEGDYNAQSREMICRGTYADAVTGKDVNCRMVTRFVTDDQHVFEMWGPDPTGHEVKWMEITYNRAK
jgi:hypothetical protein